jgi:hypothetical protein
MARKDKSQVLMQRSGEASGIFRFSTGPGEYRKAANIKTLILMRNIN